MTIRKRKEQKDADIYLNNKPIPQVHRLKYLGIIFDSKLTFKEHINYTADKCTKLIFSLPKVAKLNWGVKSRSPEDSLHRMNLTPPPIWSSSVD
jgi:hypothetical protein